MCLAIPAYVEELREFDQATVEVGGVRSKISLAMIDDVQVGDYVIVHVGYAITKLNVKEAEESLALFRELAETIGASTDALHPRVS